MYGGVTKCTAQLKADENFLEQAALDFKSRQEASMSYLDDGWRLMKQDDYNTAMKRFNQAWLLDDKSPIVYLSFGVLMQKKGDANEAANFLEKATELAANNRDVLALISNSYSDLYNATKDKKYQKKATELTNKNK